MLLEILSIVVIRNQSGFVVSLVQSCRFLSQPSYFAVDLKAVHGMLMILSDLLRNVIALSYWTCDRWQALLQHAQHRLVSRYW